MQTEVITPDHTTKFDNTHSLNLLPLGAAIIHGPLIVASKQALTAMFKLRFPDGTEVVIDSPCRVLLGRMSSEIVYDIPHSYWHVAAFKRKGVIVR